MTSSPIESKVSGGTLSLAERLAELQRTLDHLRVLRPRVSGAAFLQRNLSLRSDILFSLMTVCHLVIDLAGEMATRRGEAVEDSAQAVGLLAGDERVPEYLVRRLEGLPALRAAIVSEPLTMDLERVRQVLDEVDDVREFMHIVAEVERTRPA